MATDIDPTRLPAQLATSLTSMREAESLGRSLANRVSRIFLVGCGAPNRNMLVLEYWLQHFGSNIEVHRYFPAEFIAQNPAHLDENSLVLLGSKSGTTPETVSAAEFARQYPCVTVGVTQTQDKPLAQAVEHPLLLGETDAAHYGTYMIMQALVGAIMAERSGWALQEKLMRSLEAMPQALTHEQIIHEERAAEIARLYHQDRIVYHVASGPMFSTAYVFGVCFLMEMQWMHSYPIEAAEFFHGPFEIVDETTPLFLMLGEDPSRPLMERVVRFCKKYTERLAIYDAADFEMTGIDPEIRPIVGPLFMQAVLDRVTERLAVWHNQPLSTRRYMWKTEY